MIASKSWQRVAFCLILLLTPCYMCAQSSHSNEADRAALEAVAPAKLHYSTYVPMTHKERLHDYFKRTYSPEAVLRSAAGSGINQALNDPPEWGQGALGYSRRFASSFATHIVQSTIMYGTSAALHEDNRYFASGLTGFKARLKYAIISSFKARHEDGSMHISISRLTSYAAAAAISRAWQPQSTVGPLNAFDSFAIAVGAETGFNVAREFLPRILHSRPPVTAAVGSSQ